MFTLSSPHALSLVLRALELGSFHLAIILSLSGPYLLEEREGDKLTQFIRLSCQTSGGTDHMTRLHRQWCIAVASVAVLVFAWAISLLAFR